MGLDPLSPPSTCVHLSLTPNPLRVDVINGWPHIESAYRHRRRLWGQPGHAPPIIKMGGKTAFCPPIIRRKFVIFYFKKETRKKAEETETKKEKYKEKGVNCVHFLKKLSMTKKRSSEFFENRRMFFTKFLECCLKIYFP